MTPQAFVIATVPRSGSTLLCHLLTATGVAGRPASHFHRPSLAAWMEDLDVNGPFAEDRDAIHAAVVAARGRGMDDTGLFGLRMQRASAAFWLDCLRRLHPDPLTDRQRVEAAFGPTLWVHLSRSDRTAQAVSRLRAEQTGLWHRHADGRELERLAPPASPHYDRAAIARHRNQLVGWDAEWNAWFDAQGIVPLRLHYEMLAANPRGGAARVLRALDRDPRALDGVAIPTARLADGESRVWIKRFDAGRRTPYEKAGPPRGRRGGPDVPRDGLCE